MVGDSTAEHDDIEQRVDTKTVGTVHRHTSGFYGSVQTRDDLVIAILVNGKDIAGVFGRSRRGSPARTTRAFPSPEQVWALVQLKYARPSPTRSCASGNDGLCRLPCSEQ